MEDSIFVVYEEDPETQNKRVIKAFWDEDLASEYCIDNNASDEYTEHNYTKIPIVDTFRRWPPSNVDSDIDFEI